MDHLAILKIVKSSGIEHLQVLQRIAVHHQQIGQVTCPHATNVRFLTENFRVVGGGVLNNDERLESGFLVQFQLANQTETVHLINEAGIIAAADQAAALLEFQQGSHFDSVILLPESFISGCPTD